MLARHTEVGAPFHSVYILIGFVLNITSEDSEISFYRNKSFIYIKIWKGYKCFIISHSCENRKRGKIPHTII